MGALALMLSKGVKYKRGTYYRRIVLVLLISISVYVLPPTNQNQLPIDT